MQKVLTLKRPFSDSFQPAKITIGTSTTESKIRINEKSLIKPEIKSEIKPEINEIDIDEVINIEPSIQQTEEPIFDLKKEMEFNGNLYELEIIIKLSL